LYSLLILRNLILSCRLSFKENIDQIKQKLIIEIDYLSIS